MTTSDEDASGIDWGKLGEVHYDQADEMMAMSEAYSAQREQFRSCAATCASTSARASNAG